MSQGYCTAEDVRRALQEADSSFEDADLAAEFVTDAIEAETEWLEKASKRHWYEPDGVADDYHDLIPTSPKSREDEEDIVTKSGFVVDGEGPDPKISHANYTRIRLARRDVEEVTQLLVRNEDGEYVDWVGSADHTAGRFEDYYIQVNNGGWSEIYLDTERLDDLESYARSVYVEFSYGNEGLSKTIRRAVALRAGASLIMEDDAQIGIPDSGQLVGIESKAEQMREEADRLLSMDMDEEIIARAT